MYICSVTIKGFYKITYKVIAKNRKKSGPSYRLAWQSQPNGKSEPKKSVLVVFSTMSDTKLHKERPRGIDEELIRRLGYEDLIKH